VIASKVAGSTQEVRRLAVQGGAYVRRGAVLSGLIEAGAMLALALGAVRVIVRSPLACRAEIIDQCAFVLRRCLMPLIVSSAALGFGAPGLQAGNFLNLLGSVDRLGAFFVINAVREIAPFLTGMIVAGVAGTAICADLGARKVREELDALQTLALDPVKTLVAPRFVAVGLMTPCLLMFAIVAATFGGYAAGVFALGETSAGFFATFSSNFATPDLWGAVAKTVIFGFFTAAVACRLGMTVSGGPEGVGRAVNRMVVIAFVGIWVMNYVVTSFVLGAFPETQVLR
jgi:phospholipid/cholesterol/gamma-HCH transport system permease protein